MSYCAETPSKPDSVFKSSFLSCRVKRDCPDKNIGMPAYFYPSRMAAQTDNSSVAASGIAIPQYNSKAVYGVYVSYVNHVLSDVGFRSSLWLSHPVNSGIVPPTFPSGDTRGVPNGTPSPLPGSPLPFCCLDFPEGTRRYPPRIQHSSARLVYHKKMGKKNNTVYQKMNLSNFISGK